MEELRNSLKVALASVFSFYLKAHNFHFNVEGPDFYEYHNLFSSIYDEVYGSIDPLGEHLRTVQSYVPASFKRFGELSKVADATEVKLSSKDMISTLLADNDLVIAALTDSFDLAIKNKQQGLANFLADRIDQHQKHAWFLRASSKQ